jgi:hypothetical protein
VKILCFSSIQNLFTFKNPHNFELPVMVAKRSKAYTVFARSEAGIVPSNPTQGIDVWCLCVCGCVCVRARFSVFVYRQRPCDELITGPRSPTEYIRFSKPK